MSVEWAVRAADGLVGDALSHVGTELQRVDVLPSVSRASRAD